VTTTLSSRQFNQDSGKAKSAARLGPVVITDRGEPSYVLLSYQEYQRLSGKQPSIVELLTMSDTEIGFDEQLDFDAYFTRSKELSRAVDLS
jgi:prevent-host-death family protein